MALSAIPGMASTDAVRPIWHRWLSPTGRHFAARTVPLPEPLSGPMIVSADSGEELDEVLGNAEEAVSSILAGHPDDVRSATVHGFHDAPVPKLFQCAPDRAECDPVLIGEVAFRWQAVVGAEAILPDVLLDEVRDLHVYRRAAVVADAGMHREFIVVVLLRHPRTVELPRSFSRSIDLPEDLWRSSCDLRLCSPRARELTL